jgi:ADP-ribose pyrophosphatase YjhB (NUDIX family)
VGALIRNGDGQVLLARRGRPPEVGCWGILGGKVEFGELLTTTAVREVQEESGLDVRIVRLLCVTDHIVPAEGAHWVSPAYLCAVVGGVLENREPEAIPEIGWFELDALPGPLTITAQNALAALMEVDR